MMGNQENRTATAQIDLLTEQVDNLIDACGRLQNQNQQLSTEKEELNRERQDLLGRNREAKLRIDQVVERLRELDAG
jgi:cell division protein ZapB